jgi:hypothetical protein
MAQRLLVQVSQALGSELFPARAGTRRREVRRANDHIKSFYIFNCRRCCVWVVCLQIVK